MEDYVNDRLPLIQKLQKILPYPESWYKKQTTAQLRVIYYQRVTNAAAPDPEMPTPIQRVTRRCDPDTGEQLVLTDGHGWEPEQN